MSFNHFIIQVDCMSLPISKFIRGCSNVANGRELDFQLRYPGFSCCVIEQDISIPDSAG